MEKRSHLKAPSFLVNTGSFILFSDFIFFTFSCRDRAAWPRCWVRAHGVRWPVRPFGVCRDDMNVSRSRSDLWMQQPPQLDYCRKHLPPAAGFLPIPPNTERKVGGLRPGGARCSEEPKYGLTNAHYVTATLFKTMLQKC